MLSASVKITPSNQTLILASERRGSSNRAVGSSAIKAGSSGGSVLSRVTIVATQPDTSVFYVQADYAPEAGAAIGGPANQGTRDFATWSAAGVSGSSSSYLNLKPVEQYALTQRLLTQGSASRYIDAYA